MIPSCKAVLSKKSASVRTWITKHLVDPTNFLLRLCNNTAVWSEIYACAIFSLWLHVLAPKSPSRACDVPGTAQANEGAAPVQASSSQQGALSRSQSISLRSGFNTSMHFRTSDEAMPWNAFWWWDLPSVRRASLPAATPSVAWTMSQAWRTPSAQRGCTSGEARSLTQVLTQN